MNLEHEDYFNKKGDAIPSVTTILKILNKPELVDWANFMGFIKINTKEYTAKAAWIGTLTHYYIERSSKKKIISFKFLYKQNADVIKSVNKAYKGFVEWRKKYKPKFKKCELKVQNDKFGGTIDSICEIEGKKYIVDYKTSKGVYPSMFLQLAAYNLLLRDEKELKIDYVAILVLNKNKVDYKFYRMDVKHLEKYYENVFLLMYELYIRWQENLKYDWKVDL
jgi:ATP-dependent exoDNAse (exonuclease V) beta subunit (contains helicase and exonuclease domains)